MRAIDPISHTARPNAFSEGLFGRLKVEFFHGRDWQGVAIDEFERMLDVYLTWYRDVRRKSNLAT